MLVRHVDPYKEACSAARGLRQVGSPHVVGLALQVHMDAEFSSPPWSP